MHVYVDANVCVIYKMYVFGCGVGVYVCMHVCVFVNVCSYNFSGDMLVVQNVLLT